MDARLKAMSQLILTREEGGMKSGSRTYIALERFAVVDGEEEDHVAVCIVGFFKRVEVLFLGGPGALSVSC